MTRAGHAKRDQAAIELVERTGITEQTVKSLVQQFYEKARIDPLLGPIFAAHVVDWDAHLERMCAFWSSVALMSGRYHGRPMEKHSPLNIDAAHFDRWLTLFGETAEEVCSPTAAAHFVERARRIAESLELGVAVRNGVVLRRNERYHAKPQADLKGVQ